MNDADLEMAELAEVGNAMYAARKAGVCPHASVRYLTCTDGCGRTFRTEQEWFDAMDDVIGEWL